MKDEILALSNDIKALRLQINEQKVKLSVAMQSIKAMDSWKTLMDQPRMQGIRKDGNDLGLW